MANAPEERPEPGTPVSGGGSPSTEPDLSGGDAPPPPPGTPGAALRGLTEGLEAATGAGDRGGGTRSAPTDGRRPATDAPQGQTQHIDAPPTGGLLPAPQLDQRFGKYELVRELGRGGMGAVYQAFHPGLKRHFALKILLPGPRSGEHAARLQREAQALARLTHPGIVAVHDVGEEEGRLYFAMEYVEGESLDRRVAEGPMPSREAAAIVAEIAEAVQVAHDAGVLHRDLKPANILQDRSGRLKVSDFGLAKVEDPAQIGTTRSGAIMGTPPYLSPEHVEEGMRAVDAQSDVYQLGAVLYELLTGCRPYDGDSSTDILIQIARRDPPQPRTRDPRIDPAVETICLKAMAREKSVRYRSARALAEDCRRFVAGEAIVARPEPWWSRSMRWTRRRKALSGALAVAASGIALAALLALRARALEAEMLGTLRDSARSSVDAVLMVRRVGGKLRPARETFFPPLESAARRALERAPQLAEPHYHLGRAQRALLRFDDAFAEHSLALARDPDHAGALYERAVVQAHRYDRRLAALRDDWLRRVGKARVSGEWFASLTGPKNSSSLPPDDELAEGDPEARALRDAVRTDLARLETVLARAGGGDDGLGTRSPGWLSALRGLALSYGGVEERERARALLDEATGADPLLAEAWEARARLEEQRGSYAEAIEVLTRALTHDKGYIPFWLLRGEARRGLGLRRQSGDGDPAQVWQDAESDLAAAIELDPEQADAWTVRARLRFSWGVWMDARSGGADEKYALAAADFDRALALDDGSSERWLGRASLTMIRALFHDRMGKDPVALYQAALADYDRVLALAPALLEAWLDRAETRNNWAVWLTRQQRDPGDLFARAVADLDEAIRLAPESRQGWLRRGSVRMNWGVGIEEGGDPVPLWDDAARDFERASELDPGAAEPLWRLGNLLSYRAGSESRHGRDPRPWTEKAIAALRRATEVDPKESISWETKANLLANWAGWAESRGEDGAKWLAEADADYGHAVELHPKQAHLWISIGDLRRRWASLEARHGKDPGPRWDQALEAYGKAAELQPTLDSAWMARGSLHHQRATMRESRGEDGRKDFEAAQADLDRAVAASPSTGGARLLRAQMAIDRGGTSRRRGEDPAAYYAAAEADLAAEMAVKPGHPELLRARGVLHMARGEWAAAAADLEAAEKADPRAHPYYRRMLEDARRRAAEGGK